MSVTELAEKLLSENVWGKTLLEIGEEAEEYGYRMSETVKAIEDLLESI